MSSGVFAILMCALVLNCNALNCRTDGGPKEDDLKRVFMSCMKKMDSKSNNSSRGNDWRTEEQNSYRGNSRDQEYDRNMKNTGGRNVYEGMNRRYDDMNRRDDNMNSRDESMNHRDDGIIRRNDGMNRRNDGVIVREDSMNQMVKGLNNGDGMNDGSAQSDENMNAYSKFKGHRAAASPSPRRQRREQRADGQRNSGHRSQYNPNASERPEMNVDSYMGDRVGSDVNMTSVSDKGNSCVVHCFLEDLEMTGDNGMPDRYMTTHAITKGVKNEDLRDFLQESVEECFQILYNENSQDKCEFSKNLMMCLAEKGRANCDDWKEDGLHF